MILILRNNIQNKFWINNNITRKKTRREHYPIEKYGKLVDLKKDLKKFIKKLVNIYLIKLFH